MADLNAIMLFCKVWECGSFSKAAKLTGSPISTVSRKISELEQGLGLRLMERSTRALHLTDAGNEYYKHCHQAIDTIEQANVSISSRLNTVVGTLRMTMPPGLERCLIMPLVTGFQLRYPEVRVNIYTTEENIDLYGQDYDLAFRVGELADSGLHARQLMHYRHLLVTSPAYIASKGLPQHPADLQYHRVIAFAASKKGVRWMFTRGKKKQQISLIPSLVINDHLSKQFAVEQGLGITELPQILCADELKTGRLVEVLTAWRFMPFATSEVPLSIVYPSNKQLAKLVRLFVDYAVGYMRGG